MGRPWEAKGHPRAVPSGGGGGESNVAIWASPTPRRLGGRVRLVAADDYAATRSMLEAVLRRIDGVQLVGVARDGAEAVRLVDELTPDVALLDVTMPVMDGLEATKLIRSRAPRTSVLLSSVDPRAEIRRRAREAGADGYLAKGFGIDDFLEAMRQLFPSGGIHFSRSQDDEAHR